LTFVLLLRQRHPSWAEQRVGLEIDGNVLAQSWLALLRKEFDGTRRSRRGEGRQVSEYDFGRAVKSESSATLYEVTNREKLKQERA
jgi:hypothetical protein